MTPFFFGDRGEQLYGVYHPPKGRDRSAALVICAPGPQEAMQSHWALRRLAVFAANEGFHVLRFDYFGTGDSAGKLEEASIERWIGDVRKAAAEVAELGNVRTVSLLGMRLGAALAAEAVAGGLAACDLILWEPVIRGCTYLADLDGVQARKLADRLDRVVLREELLGFRMTSAMRRDIERLDIREGLLRKTNRRAGRTSLFHADDDADIALVARAAADKGVPIDVHRIASDPTEDRGDKEMALLSTGALTAMTAHLAGKERAA